ncbi:hypothetical protein LZ554_008853 [Drepanopeziza brunnea f. sp. 'monogermtubi']|nr:hypothetical protein LZ554_008853 [Drepanopeziza brunnea f. sp. 'monogermtubi']
MQYLRQMTSREIREALSIRGMDTTGTRPVITARLQAKLVEDDKQYPPVQEEMRRVVTVEAALVNGQRDFDTLTLRVPAVGSSFDDYAIVLNEKRTNIDYKRDIINFPSGIGPMFQAMERDLLQFDKIESIMVEDISFADFVLEDRVEARYRDLLSELFKSLTSLKEIIVFTEGRPRTHDEAYGEFSKPYRGYSVDDLDAQDHLSEDPVHWIVKYFAKDVYTVMPGGTCGTELDVLLDSYAQETGTEELHKDVQVYFTDFSRDLILY